MKKRKNDKSIHSTIFSSDAKSFSGIWRITLSASIFIVAVLLACVFFVKSVAEKNMKAVLLELDSYAKSSAMALDIRISDDFGVLNSVAVCLSEMEDVNQKALSALIAQVNHSNDFSRMGYAALDGSVDMHDLDGSVYHMDFSDEDFFKKALSGEDSIQDTCKDTYSDNYIVRYAVPVRQNDEIKGVLVAIHNSKVFSDVVNLNEWSGYGYVNIINSNGDFVIRAASSRISDDALSLFDLGTFTEYDRKVLENTAKKGGKYSYTTSDGEKMSAVIKPLGVNDWHLMCSLAEDYITTPYYKNAFIVIMTLIVTLFIFIFITAAFLRVITRSYKTLNNRNKENAVVIKQSGKRVIRYDISTHTAHHYGDIPELFGLPETMENYPESIISLGVVLPESVEFFTCFYEDIASGFPTGSTNVRLRLAGGAASWFHADYSIITDKKGASDFAIISFYDNTEVWEKELAYQLRRNELSDLIERSLFYLEANLMTGRIEKNQGDIIDKALFDDPDITLQKLVEWDSRNHVYPDDSAAFLEFFDKNRLISLYAMGVFSDSFEFRTEANGDFLWNRVTVQMVKYPYTDDIKIYLVFTDITDEFDERNEFINMASHDMLTGLMNRETTMRKIEKYLFSEGAELNHAFFMIDIDNFKKINDTLGHEAGDKALSELADSISSCFDSDDFVGKIGGDEFLVFYKNVADIQAVRDKARELLNNLERVYASDNVRAYISGSIGITMYHGGKNPAKSLNLLYAEADAALYKAKAIGKNCFVIADENDEKSGEFLPPANGIISLNLRGLLNHLGGGIEIYHGTPDGKLVPIFCNETFLRFLGGMTEQEYLDIYDGDAFDGVHPDDCDELKKAFEIAYKEKKQFQHTYRLREKNNNYIWVTNTSSFVYYDDGSCDVYSVYADAEQMMREKAALQEKYDKFRNNHLLSDNDVFAYIRLNLTNDTCDADCKLPFESAKSTDSVESFFESILCRVDSKDEAECAADVFSKENLILRYRQGDEQLSAELPFVMDDDMIKWLRMTVKTVENPETHDFEALVRFFDIDREKRMQYIVRRLIDTDYEFFGQIDVKTARIMILGANTEIEQELMHNDNLDYNEVMPTALRHIMRDDFYVDGLAALSLDKIIAELEKSDTYTCTFPTKEFSGLESGFRKWRCCYMGGQRSVIMMSRINITATVEGEIDMLTGLYNQFGFYHHAAEELHRRPDTRFRLHRFDIDGFKLLNDTLGFDKGDQLLRDLGATLRRRTERFGGDVIFARLDADHFVSLRPEHSAEAQELISDLNEWLEKYSLNFSITSHMGVYAIEDIDMPVSAMCDRALLALKSVKHSFSQRVGFYDDSLRGKLIQEQELAAEMESALETGQFEVYFQPQVDYTDDSLIGAEALVRWRHPERGLISPGVFIPLFESNGFITRLDEYVWNKSAEYVRKWMDAPTSILPFQSPSISRVLIFTILSLSQ